MSRRAPLENQEETSPSHRPLLRDQTEKDMRGVGCSTLNKDEFIQNFGGNTWKEGKP
jgi:hypothetical protein